MRIDSEVEQRQLVRLITWRSGVRFLPSLHLGIKDYGLSMAVML